MHASPRPFRFLIVDGNVRAARDMHRDSYGLAPGESYAASVQTFAPTSLCDVAMPADDGANIPDAGGLQSYDGIFLTGSALNIYTIEPAVTRQIDLMRAIYQSQVPVFGSCWGIQIGAVAAGGTVHLNPKGREMGFARAITRTAAGRNHPLLAGRPDAWDAPAIHLDEVAVLPGDAMVLARNAMSDVQAAEFSHGGGVFWGVQYHPEFSLREIATIMRRRAEVLVGEGFARTVEAFRDHCDALAALHDDPARRDIAWVMGLDEQVLDPLRRMTEIGNFIEHRVKPITSRRGRA
ncbi:MAG: type 1 glutamine amidotransferase [Beijerinckiaceae bacterium]